VVAPEPVLLGDGQVVPDDAHAAVQVDRLTANLVKNIWSRLTEQLTG
jgi:hypothetical protein